MNFKLVSLALVAMILHAQAISLSTYPNSNQLNKLKFKAKHKKSNLGRQKSIRNDKSSRMVSLRKRTKVEPMTTTTMIILISVTILLIIINIVFGILLDKFLIEKQLNEWRTRLTEEYLNQRTLKEKFCHDLRILNTSMIQIYDMNEFRKVLEFMTIYHNFEDVNSEIKENILTEKLNFVQIISQSREFMGKAEEYYCQMNYDLFGEQEYLSLRLNSLSNTIESPSIGGPVFETLTHMFSTTFFYLVDDDVWKDYSKYLATDRHTLGTKSSWMEKLTETGTKKGLVLSYDSPIANEYLANINYKCITGAGYDCNQVMLGNQIKYFFGSFYSFMGSFNKIVDADGLVKNYSHLWDFLNVVFILYHNLVHVTSLLIDKYKIDKSFADEELNSDIITAKAKSLARLGIEYIKKVNKPDSEKNIKKAQKHFNSDAQKLVSKEIIKMFRPLRKLQLKKYFFRICRFVFNSLKEQLYWKTLLKTLLKKVMTELLVMRLGTLLGGIVGGVIGGVLALSETLYQKIKKWKKNRADAKAEYEFLDNSLIPNIKLHLEYTKCNFYAYYFDFINNQLESVDNTDEDTIELEFALIKSEDNIESGPKNIANREFGVNKANYFGAKVKVLAQRLSKLKIGSNSKRTMEIQINSGVRDSLMVYLDKKCIRASSFCKSLLASGFLNNILTEEQLEAIKSKVFYYIYTGPISKVMKIEKAEGSYKISSDFLYKNNFFMHTVDYPMSESNDDRNAAFLYCRACSNFALADSISNTSLYKDILTDSTALDIDSDLLEKFSQEITTPEDNLDSISTYIRKIDIKAKTFTDKFINMFRSGLPRESTSVKYVQIYALGYKYIGPTTDFSNKYELEIEERKDEQIYNEFQRIYKFIPNLSRAEFKISVNLFLDTWIVPKMTKKSEFNFESHQWNFFPHDTRYDYSYSKYILPNELDDQNFEVSPLFGVLSIPDDDIPGKTYRKIHGVTRKINESDGKFIFSATYDSEFIAQDSMKMASSIISKNGYSKTTKFSQELFTPPQSPNDICKINPNTNTSVELRLIVKCFTQNIQNHLLRSLCEDCDLNGKRFETFRSFLVNSGYKSKLTIMESNKKIGNPMKTTITELYGNDQNVIKLLKVGKNPDKKLFDIHEINDYPSFEDFQNYFLGHGLMEKNPKTDKSFVFAFHQSPIKDKNRELKGKHLFKIDSITGGKLHGLFPVKINPRDKIVYFIRRISDPLKPPANILYDIKLHNTNIQDELNETSNKLSIDNSSINLTKEELEFAKMANADIKSSGASNMDVSSFSNVPNSILMYVEYMLDYNLTLDTHLSQLYDKRSILGNVLFDTGFIPVFPQYSPDDNLVDSPEDFENELANNPGNYFMVFWLKERFGSAFRFWIKKNYMFLEENTSIICKGYNKKRKMESNKIVMKRKKEIIS